MSKYKLETLNLKYIDSSIKEAFILLPEDYTPNNKYKVLYMHDGQNVFFKESSLSNYSWGIKNVIEELTKNKKIEPMIVAALSHGESNRTSELTSFKSDVTNRSTGLGDAYSDFFINTFVPLVEEKSVSNSFLDKGILGSSLGGLMSAYIEAKFSEIFSKIGVFSLASWISKDDFMDYISKNKKEQIKNNPKLKDLLKYYIYVGSHEIVDYEGINIEDSAVYINDSIDYLKTLLALGINKDNVKFTLGINQTHSEKSWNMYLEDFLTFMDY